MSNGTFRSAMVLQHLRFIDEDKCVLYVYFGEKGNIIYGLRSEFMSPHDMDILKKTFKNTNEKDITLSWLKKNIPESYKKAYREYDKSKFVLFRTYAVNS